MKDNMLVCPNCGAANDLHAEYCAECGDGLYLICRNARRRIKRTRRTASNVVLCWVKRSSCVICILNISRKLNGLKRIIGVNIPAGFGCF
jgi:uncharacterized membrane protein YvbJ